MPTLYVTEPGARLEKEYGRILVAKEDEVLLTVPFTRVDHVVLVGRVGVTTPLLHALLDHDVGLTLLRRWGGLRGRIVPRTAKNIPLRHRQYARAADPAFCLAVAKAVATGKLGNYRTLARRMARNHGGGPPGQEERLARAAARVADAVDAAFLRGIEGSGTKAYFALLSAALHADFPFVKRSRRPPRDPVNALLSLGYSLLTQNLITACELAGLDPYDGFFHADKYGRPALALDLVEEFRGIIVDSVVLNLVNRRRIRPADFEPGADGGIYLSRAGQRTFFTAYTARLNTEVIYPPAGRALTYQKIFEAQARHLRRVIEGGAPTYRPFRTR